MNAVRLLYIATLAAWLGLAGGARAEDIDLYSATPVNSGRPNVLFVLDNAANFEANAANCTYVNGTAPSLNGTAGGIEQCALYNVVNGLPVNADGTGVVNIGLMAYNANNMRDINGANCGGSNGGCLMVPLMEMTAANKATFMEWVKSWRTSGGAGSGFIKANGEATGAAMQEAWAYYAGGTGLSGRSYAGVKPPAGCQKNFVIFIGNAFNNSGTPGDGSSARPDTALNAAPGVTAAQKVPITIPSGPYGIRNANGSWALNCGNYSMGNHTGVSGLYADEWARYMFENDLYGSLTEKQSITTYTVGLLGSACKPDYPALLTSMAQYGGGKYYATSSYSEIYTAIQNILNEVQAVNSVFTAASLPVSVNAQGTYLNQIFLGMFRPDGAGAPRWLGNLKQYQFILGANGTLQIGDSAGNPALNSVATGFFAPNAISFWTSNAGGPVNGFFVNDVKGAGGAFDSPDGEFVEKGGAAQVLRNSLLTVNYTSSPAAPRRLYTYCPAGTGCTADLTHSSNVFATTNSAITTSLLGVADSTTRTALINWVRGEDNRSPSDEKGPGGGVNVRTSIHGDVLHSRPVVVNYGDSRGLVVFYGANDGVFRAINGSQTASITVGGSAVPPGGELWGVVLPDHFTKLARQRNNTPEITFPAPADPASANRKDYFADGSTGLYQRLRADGSTTDKAYLYLTMRRGGRFIYALDVSDPAAPTMMWKISSADSGFAELGQTWSLPRVTVVKGYANPVLIFGAGYDPAEDAEPPTANTMGRGIFIVDAITGVRVWSAVYTAGASGCSGTSTQASCAVNGMNWAIPSDLALMDRDHDGYTDRIYASDVGGNVWRVDLEPGGGQTPDFWQVTPFAALGCNSGTCASGTTPRKFFYPPTVVSVGEAGVAGAYDAVLLGSGDREHPLRPADPVPATSAFAVTNRFYMLKDTHTGKDATTAPAHTLITESAAAPDGLFDATSASYDRSRRGYYITLGTGEKVVNAPTTIYGQTFFGTNQPSSPDPNSCSANLGVARGYALNPFTSIRTSSVFDGGGMPPGATTGVVSVTDSSGQTGDYTFCISCGGQKSGQPPCDKALQNCNPSKNIPKKPRRTYWYKR